MGVGGVWPKLYLTNDPRRKPTPRTRCPTLFDKWHRIFYMPSRRDAAGHTKACDYPAGRLTQTTCRVTPDHDKESNLKSSCGALSSFLLGRGKNQGMLKRCLVLDSNLPALFSSPQKQHTVCRQSDPSSRPWRIRQRLATINTTNITVIPWSKYSIQQVRDQCLTQLKVQQVLKYGKLVLPTR